VVDQLRHWFADLRVLSSPIAIALALGIPVLSFVLGLVLMLALPPDYFVRAKPPGRFWQTHKTLRLSVWAGKNLLGALFVLAGLVMAVPLVPGPGVLFIVIGLGLVDIPGKRALELRLLREPHVLSSVNKLRTRFGKQPLLTRESDVQSVVDSRP
jgi:hypothetical protein